MRPFAAAISLIVFGRADKLSGIMPASQSINYGKRLGCEREREREKQRAKTHLLAHTSSFSRTLDAWYYANEASERELLEDREAAATNAPAVYFIDHRQSLPSIA